MLSLDFYFHDVGQGDCTHIEIGEDDSEDREIYLIDFGYKKRTFNGDFPPDQTLQVLVDRITAISKARNKQTPYIDHLFVTHPDGDHWNYLNRLVTGYDIDGNDLWKKAGWKGANAELQIDWLTYGSNESDYAKVAWKTITDAALNKTFLQDQAHESQKKNGAVAPTWTGAAGKLKIYLISSNFPRKGGGAANPKSLALIFEFDGFKAMLLGDAEPTDISEKLKEWYPYNNNAFLRCDLLKLAHHGSRHGTPPYWPKLVRPKWAFVSGDYFWSHPYCEALDNVKNAGTLATNGPKHWVTCYSDTAGDYSSNATKLGMFSTLWYVVTNPSGVTADDADGFEHTCKKGMYTGVTWQIQKFEGDPDPKFSYSPENVWPGPDAIPK